MRATARDLAVALGAQLLGDGEVAVVGVSNDTRTLAPGQLFVALGAARDGHDFVADAVAAGASACLTTREVEAPSVLVVDDTLAALADLGCYARARMVDRVIGVTGSVGKTTVKDLLASALATRYRTTASRLSFNAEIGVPLTLANAPDDAEAVVVEMGARGIGHIAQLAAMARPTVGVVTAVGHVHTELFGTIEDVARGKSELIIALPPSGIAVLNADDGRVAAMASLTSARVLRYGMHGSADVTAENVMLDDELRPTFTLRTPEGSATVRLMVHGAHQVGNALGAAAAAVACDLGPEQIAAGLVEAATSPWRMELHLTSSGVRVVNDAYNANPLSVAAALRSLAALPARRRVAVLGTMAELGPVGEAEHRAIGALAAALGIEVVAVAESRYGVPTVDDVEAAVASLAVVEGDAVLFKGSRVAGLERGAALLLERQ